jgi:hypothetical protein
MATTSIHIRKQSQAFGGAPKRARRDEQEEADAAAAVTESSTLDYSSSSSSSSSSSEDSSDRGKRVKLNPMDDLIADCMAAFQHAVGWGTNMGAESFHATIQTVRRLLFQQKDEESVRKFIVRGLLALVSETLRIWGDYDAKDGPYPSLIQYEAIWILVELTSREETSLTNTVVMSGIVKMENLTKFMNKIQVKVRENAVWLLANICGGHDAFRSEASQNRDLLVALIGSFEKGAQVDNRPLLKVCSFATGNLVREANGQAAPMELVLFLVPVVSMMLKHMVEKKFNTFSVIDLFVALKSMLAHSNAVREALFRHGIVDTLFTALELYTSQRAIEGMIILPILQCLAELAAGAVASHVAAVACHRILFFADAFLDRNSSVRLSLSFGWCVCALCFSNPPLTISPRLAFILSFTRAASRQVWNRSSLYQDCSEWKPATHPVAFVREKSHVVAGGSGRERPQGRATAGALVVCQSRPEASYWYAWTG